MAAASDKTRKQANAVGSKPNTVFAHHATRPSVVFVVGVAETISFQYPKAFPFPQAVFAGKFSMPAFPHC